jgi:non-ribosomal peptide synthetase component F
LDPAYPKERIQHLAESARAKVVLCSPAYVDILETLVENAVPVDSGSLEPLPVPHTRHQSRADSHNAAYIIPTSGTTGQPKLTLLEHRNFCTGAEGHVPGLLYETATPVRVLQFAAHSFDASIVEILTPLMIGGTICIPDEDTRLNDIAKAINDMRVTWACLTPTFVRFLDPTMVPTLATIILMGEAMSQANLDTWTKINLVNGYVVVLPCDY